MEAKPNGGASVFTTEHALWLKAGSMVVKEEVETAEMELKAYYREQNGCKDRMWYCDTHAQCRTLASDTGMRGVAASERWDVRLRLTLSNDTTNVRFSRPLVTIVITTALFALGVVRSEAGFEAVRRRVLAEPNRLHGRQEGAPVAKSQKRHCVVL
ncbi:hypothetical protein DIPPA_10591 [Diplonema papillatum]|nr:hypothetical protein DIPPA_10591 [Diplonema papillatum]